MKALVRLSVALLGGILPTLGFAYYDDVHYALTYYMARKSGFTAVQAYRIASVCVSVDYDSDTEPVQKLGQFLQVIKLNDSIAQDPRFAFHAMRDVREYPKSVGKGEEAGMAQGDVGRQIEGLFNASLHAEGNLGSFLHALQDEVPHRGYGTAWGHWPVDIGAVDEYAGHGLPIGGTTDWISYREFDVVTGAEKSCAYMRRFLEKVSPHQFYQPYDEAAFSRLIAQMAQANPFPKPLDTEFKRSQYVQRYSSMANILGHTLNLRTVRSRMADPEEMEKLSQQLGIGISEADYWKHVTGPDVKKAISLVDQALKQQGFADMVPTVHRSYELDAKGRLADDTSLDQWVLVGSMSFKVLTSAPVEVTVKMPKQGSANEYALFGVDPVRMRPNESHTWQNLPVGELILEFKKTDGTVERKTIQLAKQVNDLGSIEVKGGVNAPPGKTWILTSFEVRGRNVGGVIPAPYQGSSAGGAVFSDPTGKASGSASWGGVPTIMVEGQEYSISLAAKNMIAEISSRTTAEKHINIGVRDPWDPPISSRTVTFLFDPANALASYKAQARGKVILSFLASASGGEYLTNGISVSFFYEKGDSQDAKDIPPPPTGVVPPPATGNPPATGGATNPPATGANTTPPATGGTTNPPATGLFNVASGPPAFDPKSWAPEEIGSGKMTTAGNALIFEVPEAGPGSVVSFSKEAISGDCELEIAYGLIGKDVGTVFLEFYLYSSPDEGASGGIALMRMDEAKGHYLYFGPKDEPGPPVEVPKSDVDSGKMKLVRKGNVWTAFQSNGSQWLELGKVEANLPKDLYFGIRADQMKGSGGVKLTIVPSIKRG